MCIRIALGILTKLLIKDLCNLYSVLNMAWENIELYEDPDNALNDIVTDGVETCDGSVKTKTHIKDIPAEEDAGRTRNTARKTVCIRCAGLILILCVVGLTISLPVIYNLDNHSTGNRSHRTNISIVTQNITHKGYKTTLTDAAYSQATPTVNRVWMTAEYRHDSTISNHLMVWRQLSSNEGAVQIQLVDSSTRIRVPVSGIYSVQASFQIVGRTCKIGRNTHMASIRICTSYQNKPIKCIKESFPESSAEFWVRTVQIIVPVISMDTGNSISFVTNNADCIYDDPLVSVMEIHQLS
ncbi:uncharacterized protein [Argopecten irradians]|uniref:uncharacterized protein n=1 Tax=Argopecten irradians TaxID=31199 RepID=UPI003723A920